MSGWFKNRLSCQTVFTVAGAYSKKIWNLISWKRGQSRMMCALSSRRKPHKRHWGSISGSTFDRWYLKKLWPVKCLMQRPRSCLTKCKSSLENFLFGAGKKILVCRKLLNRKSMSDQQKACYCHKCQNVVRMNMSKLPKLFQINVFRALDSHFYYVFTSDKGTNSPEKFLDNANVTLMPGLRSVTYTWAKVLKSHPTRTDSLSIHQIFCLNTGWQICWRTWVGLTLIWGVPPAC